MSKKRSSINSILCLILPSVSNKSRSFLSQFLMSITVFIFLVTLFPCISSSPTPPTNPSENPNKINSHSNAFMYHLNDYQADSTDDSSSIPSSVHDQPLLASSFVFAQPRTHANQFLMSNVNDNPILVPKWFTRLNNNDDDDDLDDYVPSGLLVNKRSPHHNPVLKKRKQLTKPPMEVMNEIVNSIYLKR